MMELNLEALVDNDKTKFISKPLFNELLKKEIYYKTIIGNLDPNKKSTQKKYNSRFINNINELISQSLNDYLIDNEEITEIDKVYMSKIKLTTTFQAFINHIYKFKENKIDYWQIKNLFNNQNTKKYFLN